MSVYLSVALCIGYLVVGAVLVIWAHRYSAVRKETDFDPVIVGAMTLLWGFWMGVGILVALSILLGKCVVRLARKFGSSNE